MNNGVSKPSGLIKQGIQLGSLKVIGAIGALLVNLLLARSYQPEIIGQYFISLGILVFVSQLATLGGGRLLVKKIAASYDLKEKYCAISATFLLSLLGALLCFGLYFGVLVRLLDLVVELGLFEIYVMSLFFLTIAIFQGYNKSPLGAFFQFVLQPFLFVFLVLIIPQHSLIKLYSFSVFLTLVIALGYLIKMGDIGFSRISVVELNKTFKSTLPYLSIMVLGLAVTHLVLPLSSFWLDDKSIAVMGVTARLMNVLFFVVVGARILLLPRFTKAVSLKDSKAVLKLGYVGAFFPVVTMLFGVMIIFVSSEDIMRMFGEEYVSFHELLIYSSLLLIPAAFLGWTESFLIAQNKLGYITISTIMSALVVFVLLAVLTINYGVWGAVLTSIGGKTIYTLFTAYFSCNFQRSVQKS
ncbi:MULTISPECIES: lipopolysaccharide biosynthesis protein [unclassified Vibrio]|uniref:lipopolysaccharide biosynthesis protein n=1 Tax=unclassified Vibrio TaxID=2614977 RepID=UPI003550FEC8